MKAVACLLLAVGLTACASKHPEPKSAWRAARGGASISTASLASIEFIKAKTKPVLRLSCTGGRMSALIDFGHQVTAQPRRVQLTVDASAQSMRTWANSDDWTSLLAGDGGPSVDVARSLLGGQRLVVRAELGIEGVKLMTFALDGYDAAVAPLARACGWG